MLSDQYLSAVKRINNSHATCAWHTTPGLSQSQQSGYIRQHGREIDQVLQHFGGEYVLQSEFGNGIKKYKLVFPDGSEIDSAKYE